MDFYSVRTILTDVKTDLTVTIERKCGDDITIIPAPVMKIKCGSFEVELDSKFIALLEQDLKTIENYNDQTRHDEFVYEVKNRDQMLKDRLKDHNDNKSTTPYMFTSVWDSPNVAEIIGTETTTKIHLDNSESNK